MKCVYCEANETRGVLLCYGCQVDLFPLVAAWAYCGVCGNELPADSTICPPCAQDESSSKPGAEPVRSRPGDEKNEPPRLEPLPKKTPVTRADIRQARRLQWVIKAIFAIFWLLIVMLVLWWVRRWANQPSGSIFP